ncbi:aliphatic sulfonate ABC transporter substrate-binding protein [Enterobacteriaceae bacterium BIT-l23]|nr:aliphatic sulfonate ABC transporter substrate-binding protein [Enterobacteriaceae bacterium BIT-l23]
MLPETIREVDPVRLFRGLLLAAALIAPAVQAAQQTIRIGYQKSSTLLMLAKQQGTLEQALASHNIRVKWHEFSSGLPLLEALNLNNIDISADVADTVPVFIQAAGGELIWFAREAPSPRAQAIVVAANSPLRRIQDLKGRKIAVTKAAGSYYLLIAALKQAGLSFSDITPAWLTPADGRAALESGSVDAWVTWEPFVTSARIQQHVRILTDGEGLADYQRYYLASRAWGKDNPQVLAIVWQTLRQEADWIKQNPHQAAKLLAPLWGNLAPDIVEQANARRSYQVEPVTRESLKEQQSIADAFFDARLLPRRIDTRAVEIWYPAP